jgi:adenylate kinase
VIFDGYPRTHGQAVSLDGLLAGHGRTLDHVIELEVDEDALVDRIAGRFSCARCNTPYHDRYKLPAVAGVCDVCGSGEFKRRADDTEEAVRTRMAEYRAKTAPVLPYYEARGIVRRVDGMASVEAVSAAIDAILDG